MKSPVWQGKSPATGHKSDSKKCLVCQSDLMFVTHLIVSQHMRDKKIEEACGLQIYAMKNLKPKNII